jgi:serine/threonine-protein kinase HipA
VLGCKRPEFKISGVADGKRNLAIFGIECCGDEIIGRCEAIDPGDPTATAALTSRASLSGVQPKLLAVKEGRSYRPARRDETSAFIAKLPSGALRDIACRAID